MAAAASKTDLKKKKVTTSSQSYVHDDIAFSILSKLPIKSLTRFTCAKKSWSLLFQNPTFMNTFCTNFFKPKHIEDDDETCLLVKEESWGFPSHESPCILSGEKFEKKVSLDWPPPFQQDDSHNIFPSFPLSILILGSASVNGTLCLYRGFAGAIKIVLWNPATAEFKVIPPSFQPHENTQFNYPPYGFGYDSIKDDFKNIRKVYYPLEFRSGDWVYLPDKDDPFWERDVHELDLNDSFWEEKKLTVNLYDPFWEIYSLKSNSWRKLEGVDMPVSCPGSLVNMNGFCHWLSTEGPDMVSFDYSKETFLVTPLPSNAGIKYKRMKMGLVELNGSLSYITNYDRTPDFHIWVLGELGVKESWTKFFVVGPLTCPLIYGMSIGNKNRIFFKEKEFELGWFDLNTQRIEKIEAKEESSCLHIAIYKENLLPFGGIV